MIHRQRKNKKKQRNLKHSKKQIYSWDVISMQFASSKDFSDSFRRERRKNFTLVWWRFPCLRSFQNFHINISVCRKMICLRNFLLVSRLNWQLPNDHGGRHSSKRIFVMTLFRMRKDSSFFCTLAAIFQTIAKWGVNFVSSFAILRTNLIP